MRLQEKILQFWDWFQAHEYMFKEISNPQEAIEAMDNQVLEFGLFSWEISEGRSRPHSLLISPNGDWKRLQISQQIIEAAPRMRDWEFHYCKPPKSWNFMFEMHDRFMTKQSFDASEWEYILLKNPEDLIEVLINPHNLDALEEDDKLNAGELVLINTLGEESFIRHIGALEMVREFNPNQQHYIRKIPSLKYTFEKMVFGR